MAKYHVILSKTAPSQRDALWLKPVSKGIVLYALNNGEWQPLKTVDDKDTSSPGDDEVVTVAALKQAIAEVQAYAEQQSTEDKAALEKLKQRLNTLIGADEEGESIDVTAAIDTFNEIKEFLEGIEDTTLGDILSRIEDVIGRTEEKLQSGVFYNSNTSGLTNGDGDRINNIAFEYGSGTLTNLARIESTGQNIYFQNAGITGVTGIDFDRNITTNINYLRNLNMRNGNISGVHNLDMSSGVINMGSSGIITGVAKFDINMGSGVLTMNGGTVTGVRELNINSGGYITIPNGVITGVSEIYFSNGNLFTGVASIPSTLNNIQKINMSSGEISGVAKLSTGNKSLDLANGTLNGVDIINTSGNTLKIGNGSYHAIEFGTPASLYTGWKPKIAVAASGSEDYLGIYGIQQSDNNVLIRKSDFTVTAYSPVTGSSGRTMMKFECDSNNNGTLTVSGVTLNGGSLSMNGGQIKFSGNGQIYPYYVTGGGGYYAGINISNLRGVTFADGATISGTVSGIVNTSNLALSGGTLNSGVINTPTISGGTMSNTSISGVAFYSGNTYDAGYIDELKAALGIQ